MTDSAQIMGWLETVLQSAPDGTLEREAIVLYGRYFAPTRETYQHLGDRFGVRRERIRQIDARAQRRIRRSLSIPEVAGAALKLFVLSDAFAKDVFGAADEEGRASMAATLRAKAQGIA